MPLLIIGRCLLSPLLLIHLSFLLPSKTGICIWPFLTAINFKFVPGRLRTIYVGFCGFFWFTFLAYLKSTEEPWRSPVLDLVNKVAKTNF